MIKIKNIDVMEGVLKVPWDEKLKELYFWVEKRHPGRTITCGYEWRGKSSVHEEDPLRGLDLRSRDMKDPQAIADEINKHWVYDRKRPWKKCCLFHNVGRGFHFHLQTHKNTFLKN